MKKLIAAPLFAVVVGVIGCSTDETLSGVYKGVTSQAKITAKNADDLAATSIKSGNQSASAGSASAAKSQTIGKVRAKVLSKLGGRAVGDPVTSGTFGPEIEAGTCAANPGKSTTTGTIVANSTGGLDVKATVVMDQMCTVQDGIEVVENGTLRVAFTLDTTTFEMDEITATFDMYTTEDADGVSTLNGGITVSGLGLTNTSGALTMTMTLEGSDPDTGAFKVENLIVTMSTTVQGYVSMTMAGKVYDEEFGFVEIETTAAIVMDADGNVIDGTMVVTGANGTKATINVADADNITTTVDTDGDGDTDATLDASWTELSESEYEGEIGQASITADNIDDLTLSTMEAGEIVDEGSGGDAGASGNAKPTAKVLKVVRKAAAIRSKVGARVVNVEETPGTCGGTETYYLEGSEFAYVYDNYCTETDGVQTIENGSVSGSFVVAGTSIASMSFLMDSYTEQTGGVTSAMNGEVELTGTALNDPDGLGTLTITIPWFEGSDTGASVNDFVKLEEVTMSLTSNADGSGAFSLDGIIYDADFGYYTVDTTTAFAFNASDVYTAGAMTLTGQSSSATVTIDNTGNFDAVVDTDTSKTSDTKVEKSFNQSGAPV